MNYDLSYDNRCKSLYTNAIKQGLKDYFISRKRLYSQFTFGIHRRTRLIQRNVSEMTHTLVGHPTRQRVITEPSPVDDHTIRFAQFFQRFNGKLQVIQTKG